MRDTVMKELTEAVDARLDSLLPKPEGYAGLLYEAMRYSVFSGGKRIRPCLFLLSYRAAGGQGDNAYTFAAAMEMIHTYSLIHDDLPALDNDHLRRGRATNHIVFGEDIAILAGDSLLNFAYECMIDEVVKSGDKNAAACFKIIANAAGSFGMIAGQTADVLCGKLEKNEKLLQFIQEKKTGELLKCAFTAGAALAGAPVHLLARLAHIGNLVGQAFQIQDDVLDILGDAQNMGKPVHSDEKNGKFTDVCIFGLEQSKSRFKQFYDEAANEALTLGEAWDFIPAWIHSLQNRNH